LSIESELADAVGIAKQSAWEKWKDVSVERADLQQQVDERVERERRQALHTMAEQTARLVESGELREQANELRKAVLSLTLSGKGRGGRRGGG
jgi:hypothetical protein